MTRAEVRTRIEQIGIVPAVRVTSAGDALFASNAVFHAGIPIVELTMTIPDVLSVISELTVSNVQAIVGAGTVLSVEDACNCADAGASFLTSPGLDPDIVAFAMERNIAVLPGALTATEVMSARKAGGDMIKIFPCAQLGGAAYIRALRSPFPHVPLIASGGVTQQTASEFIRAGASGLGIGEDLIPHEAVRTRNAAWIGELARRFLSIVKETRAMNAKRLQLATSGKDFNK